MLLLLRLATRDDEASGYFWPSPAAQFVQHSAQNLAVSTGSVCEGFVSVEHANGPAVSQAARHDLPGPTQYLQASRLASPG